MSHHPAARLGRALTLLTLFGLPTTLGRAHARPAAEPVAEASAPLPPPLDRVRRGMTATEVRQLLGSPKRVTRQVVFRRHVEQWLYEAPAPCRVELMCERG